MNDFLDILSIIILLRFLCIILYSRILNKVDGSCWAYQYYIKNNNPWLYRTFGISALWLIVRYYENILCLFKLG